MAYDLPVPEHHKTPEARLWLVKQVLERVEELNRVERTERPLLEEERKERIRLRSRLRGFRVLAKRQVVDGTDQAESRWVRLLLSWDAKDKTIPTVSEWQLEAIEAPPSMSREMIIPGEHEPATVTQQALTPKYNKDLYRESQRRFGKLKHPVLELLALGYNMVKDTDVAPQARVNALKEAAKYFEPQLKQVEIRQAHGGQHSGVLAVPGRMDPENWANMVAEHLEVISRATEKLNQVAGGRAPATFDGEIEEAEVVDEKPRTQATGKKSVDGVRRGVGVQDDSGVSRASSERVVEDEGTGGGGETPVELPPTVVRMPERRKPADPEDPRKTDIEAQWETAPPELTGPPRDYDRGNPGNKRSVTPPRRPIGRTRKVRDPDAEK